jgi:hypothetical protein
MERVHALANRTFLRVRPVEAGVNRNKSNNKAKRVSLPSSQISLPIFNRYLLPFCDFWRRWSCRVSVLAEMDGNPKGYKIGTDGLSLLLRFRNCHQFLW